MLDEDRFWSLMRRLGGCGEAAASFAALDGAYAEPHRAYHNAAHIADCLRQLDSVHGLAERPDEIEAAVWFHDAVYDPRAADNEERSANWATTALRQGGVEPAAIDRIAAMILATRHSGEPDSPDAALLLDVDLSILGREPDAFAEYDRGIRAEYAWVPDDEYRAGRSAVLEGFLRRPTIYRRDSFRSRYEVQARQNLERAVAGLNRPAAPPAATPVNRTPASAG